MRCTGEGLANARTHVRPIIVLAGSNIRQWTGETSGNTRAHAHLVLVSVRRLGHPRSHVRWRSAREVTLWALQSRAVRQLCAQRVNGVTCPASAARIRSSSPRMESAVPFSPRRPGCARHPPLGCDRLWQGLARARRFDRGCCVQGLRARERIWSHQIVADEFAGTSLSAVRLLPPDKLRAACDCAVTVAAAPSCVSHAALHGDSLAHYSPGCDRSRGGRRVKN